MASEPARQQPLTVQDYLELERCSEVKHEFYDGELFAMAGGSPEHNMIVANVLGELRQALRRRPCRVFASDLKVKAPTELYAYPDVTAVCGPLEFDGDAREVLLNPQLIVEVLSDSTESYDRGKKFANYRSIPSLKDYVLVSQQEVLIEHFTRRDDGTWLLRILRQGDRLVLPSLDCEIEVGEVYLKVFEAEAAEG